MTTNNIRRSCVDCASAGCDHCSFEEAISAESSAFPAFCKTRDLDPAILEEAMALYTENEENNRVTRMSAQVEYENYCKMTRVEEIAEFAKKMGFKKLGIATCVGLITEARAAAAIFRSHGFEVTGFGCKVGAQRKTSCGHRRRLRRRRYEYVQSDPSGKTSECRKNRELNVVVGLCVGHDSLFYKYSDALCTTLVTKDRVLGHNPVAALYQIKTYYAKLLQEDHGDPESEGNVANVSEYTGSGTGHVHSAPKEPSAIITPATKNERNFTFMKLLYLDCGMGAAGDMLGAALAELLPDDARDAFTSGAQCCRDPRCSHFSGSIRKMRYHRDSPDRYRKRHRGERRQGAVDTPMTITMTTLMTTSHSHDHQRSHSHDHHHDHSHRSLHDIHHIIDDLKLPEAVRTDILAVYRLIAEAESKAHDKPVSEIHFHEVGTMDAIADIASVCLLLHKLAPDQIIASPIHVGSGQVKCAHGILPVPAPATAYILKDIPIYRGSIQGELCTPTGAALYAKHFVTRFDQMPLMTPASTG